jgi:peptidoglycan lytic transglycosylase
LRYIAMGCALAALVAISASSEARPPEFKMLKAKSTVGAKAQFGVASWYGSQFEGLPTASGQPFKMEGMTCAHRKLPLGTHVRVTNLLNGRHLVLEVTDRGPFAGKRILDVSKGAAKRLGFMQAGLTPVRIQVVSYPHAQHSLLSQADTKALMALAN